MKLYLCEKPSQARDIAKILGATSRNDGYLFNQQITVTWAYGHLLEMLPPEGYDENLKRWQLDSLPIIPPINGWKMAVKKDGKKQFKVIQTLLKKAKTVVIATDADREGETIAREILNYCAYQGNIQRLWLSALDDASIKKALAALKPNQETYSLYQAGIGRSRADWLVGMNMTRLYTLLSKQKGGNSVLSVGRVQTPTLKLIVDRCREIAQFIPRPYWDVIIKLGALPETFNAKWQPPEHLADTENRCVSEHDARQVLNECLHKQAIVTDIETKRSKESAPLAFDLGTLQQICSKKWGFGAQQVLDIAQSLYETHKATTYPRTDCGYLPTSMQTEIPIVIGALRQSSPDFEPFINKLDLTLRSRIWNDEKITAHHGIIPTAQRTDVSKMTNEERKVYHLICSHYLAQFLPSYEANKTQITLSCGNHQFYSTGKVTLVTGWKVLFTKEIDEESEQILPALTEGQHCQIAEGEIKALKTKAPDYYTEGTLIAAMKNAAKFVTDEHLKQRLKESSGIGTEATRANIIETLLKRGYITKKKRNLIASPIAEQLVDMLPAVLTNPAMTALWEQALDEIASNNMTLNAFITKQTEWLRLLIEQIKRH